MEWLKVEINSAFHLVSIRKFWRSFLGAHTEGGQALVYGKNAFVGIPFSPEGMQHLDSAPHCV